MNEFLVFPIGEVLAKAEGSTISFSFNGDAEIEQLDFAKPLKGKVEVMKSEDGVHVTATDVKTTLNLICERCLKEYAHKINIDSISAEFLRHQPKDEPDFFDIFLINDKNKTIDLLDFLRQEIILHFPTISVCSTGCKGLCPYCGQDRNSKNCDCEKKHDQQLADSNKPLSKLKDLIKENGKASGTKKENL